MDSQRAGAYDPAQPWALTDALCGILARTLLRSTYQTRLRVESPDEAGAVTSDYHASAPRQPPQPKKPTAVSSQFWAGEGSPAESPSHGATADTRVNIDQGHVGYAVDYSGHHLLPRASPVIQGSPVNGDPRSYSHSLSHSLAPSHHVATDNDDDADEDQGSTPGLNNGVSPMMIDPNLAAWQGESHEHGHEHGHGHGHGHESFLHQYSDMGGDYATVPQTMIDPNLALMHDQDDFRHERHHEEGHLDEYEGGHHSFSIPLVQGGLKRSLSSPYFADESPAKSVQQPSPRRRQRGTVSCIPFPRLTAPFSGLVQEQLAHDPFWLLIVVTFLIRTTGKAAIPVFWQVMQRFPSPAMLDDEANIPELTGMIRHLGLASTRVAAIRRYAKGWMKQPPQAGLRYRVKDYAQRDAEAVPGLTPVSPHTGATTIPASNSPTATSAFPSPSQLVPVNGDSDSPMTSTANDYDLEAWEIGHLTQGRYAIDSWRIFCRDVLLGKALDWKGTGREAEFQPEWMRVMPQDKELRAYLQWMWMKEGWQWDPHTGERSVLSEEMRAAVEEGRVAYNDEGELEIFRREEQLTSAWPGGGGEKGAGFTVLGGASYI